MALVRVEVVLSGFTWWVSIPAELDGLQQADIQACRRVQ